MNVLLILVPCSIGLGLGALIAFVWALSRHQYDDLEGDAQRILFDDET